MATFKLILAPEGSVIPDDLKHKVVKPATNIIDKIIQCRDNPLIIQVTTNEVQMLVEYRHQLDVDLKAIIGLSGSNYNTIWNTYVSSMERLTIDNIRADEMAANVERSNAGNDRLVSFTSGQRRPRTNIERPPLPTDTPADDDEIGEVD